MNLEKIYPSTDTGAQAIGKLERNQNMLNQGIISNENKINVLNADNNTWLENVELKKHRKQGKYVCIDNADAPIANEFIWCTLDVYNMNENNSIINFTIKGNLYSCREEDGVWGDWEPSHTLSQIQELNKRITDLEALIIN